MSGAGAERWKSGVAALLHSGPLPRPSRWSRTADAVLALVLAACTVGAVGRPQQDQVAPAPQFGEPPPPLPVPPDTALDPGELVLAALTALPLIVRRRYPLAAFWAVLVLTLLFGQRSGESGAGVYPFLSCVVAAYSAAVHSPHRLYALASLLVGAVLMTVLHEEYFPYFTTSVVPFLALVGVGLGANAIHVWQQRVRDLQERQEAATRLAVEHERARIARELHDIVTHNVSVMVIQAGAARKVMDAAPDRAREALLAVEAGGRTAMAELRHVMGLLTMDGEAGDRAEGSDPGLAPQPGLAQVPALVDRVRATGVPVELTVTGTPAALPAGADLAAYRVVQEALTNVVRHASGARVRVTVEHTGDGVRVEVSDSGGTAAGVGVPEGGRGLIGLRERLAVYGGTLDAGTRPTGGFRVRAMVPAVAP
ncbi:sensor histidine kinase [Streptomyces cupreus]|uniref:histidine kinase n=1 Tax=Streptomyces cupreus TaxID=2759956 RepID=A0A7X1J5M9_9ACTN|nr:sensor histidine kinase [Streptomyces cupreus]MBC2903602.1 sensor histidine kinase [Streptomyces cupreus]